MKVDDIVWVLRFDGYNWKITRTSVAWIDESFVGVYRPDGTVSQVISSNVFATSQDAVDVLYRRVDIERARAVDKADKKYARLIHQIESTFES